MAASAGVSPNAGAATGTGAANAPAPAIETSAGGAAGAGQAGAPAPSIAVNAGHAAGSGSAFDATVSVSGSTDANAGVASGSGSAFNASISIAASSANAVGSGTAYGPSPGVAVNAGLASGTGTAYGLTLPKPIWTTPADLVAISALPEFLFTIPDMGGTMHFEMELDTSSGFNTVDYQDFRSDLDQTGWDYWNGAAWVPVPVGGVPNIYAGNEARYTVQTPLSEDTWCRRVRAGV